MEREIVLGDILTPQEHNLIGSQSIFPPTREGEWFIPDGVLRGIDLDKAIAERKRLGFFTSSHLLSSFNLVVPGKSTAIAISLEPIDESNGMTKDDPIILGVWDKETGAIDSPINPRTGEPRDLNNELLELYRKKGLESELHLRPKPSGEKENPPSLGEGSIGSKT